ncbi:GDPGTP exchange factor Sec2p [Penicillium cinerascens]|uniref:GDPGTP exchange factor Sec2p n=1 Tax=Penicillium cinerascens TaxID=70096 RepID=A0A9W9TDK5_9EURO|nr:GDPGTP exchange factor Sec2p [Penicillium cinerascens]KAJ5218912.1 GDPGTP exchange factor Sec2p [Penicillium cinerascens]
MLVGSPSAMTNASTSGKQCPACGGSGACNDPSEVQQRILELEGHVQELNERAALTTGKLADYEEEIHRLRSAHAAYASPPRSSSSQPPSSSHGDRALSPTQAPIPVCPETTAHIFPQAPQSRLATLTSLLPYRRGSATPTSAPVPTTPTAPTIPLPQVSSPASSDNTSELQDALNREQGLRKAAEAQLTQSNTELEELTVQLFSQANEMVAQERKARAKLEERVAVLERRDIEKRSRLERLEKAMARVDRLRALVNK